LLDNQPAAEMIKMRRGVAVRLVCRFAGALLLLTRETPEV
jgi:hypothetical protein